MAVAVNSKTWEKSGMNELVKSCKTLAESDGSWNHGKESVKRIVYNLCCQVIKGSLKAEQAINGILELTTVIPDIVSVLVDTLAILDIETSVSEEKSQRDNFVNFVSVCNSHPDIPSSLLKERLDQDLLEVAECIASKLLFQQKYVKTKTRLFYKQQKFNLLREESEGYAKLITELNQEITERITYQQVLQNIKSLIGCFDLDPNRVLDILLESFEERPEAESFYVPLFKEYCSEKKTLCHILGFKLHFFEEEETPQSLYRLAACLLFHDLIDLESLYPHLWPPDNKIREYHQKELEEAKAYAKKVVVVSLVDKTEEKKEEEAVKIDVHANNQKLGLIEALLKLGALKKAKEAMDKLPEFFATNKTNIAQTFCSLIQFMIEPVYRDNAVIPNNILKSKYANMGDFKGKVEQVKTFRDFHENVMPFMRYIGPYTAWDPILFAKLIRLGKNYMSKRQNGGISPDDEVAYFGFLNLLDEVLLPGLILLPANCCISEELWSFIKAYPYTCRYRLYGNWKNDNFFLHPKLIKARTDGIERAKYIMKRLAKENVKPSGRQLGKLCHSNPGVIFEYVLTQIQKFDNFIGPVVDSLKFLTSLSYDVLAYCIIEAVANPEKDKMKYDDTNISLWLQSLANFAGCICRKYQVELAGLMQFVANQLKAGKSIDLLLLREIVQKMAGIEISEEVTQDQLESMSGGELLRQEGGNFAQVRNTKKSSSRLKDTLMEHNLALSLGLLISQQRDGVIFHESAAGHLKLIGKLYDQCQDTLVQFGNFLAIQLSSEEFVKQLPSVDTLIMQYHIPADAAFFICRPAYTYAINSKFDELRKIDKTNKQSSSQQKMQRYIEAAEHVMKPITEQVQPLYSTKVWEDLSAPFFVTFWSLSMYDLAVPTEAYAKQVQQLQNQINAVEDNRDMPQSKKKKEKERLTSLKDKLKEEEKKQGDHVNRVLNRLKNQKELWFVSRSTKNETITQFLQLCIFPRCCFTANDALFCSKFIKVLHEIKTPNFSTLICCDRIFNDITYTVTSCTENEAHRYGRFLCAAMEIIMRWHSAKEIYEKECGCYPGFVTVFRKGSDSNNKADQLDYENYRHVCHKWHFRFTKAMVCCLESGKYIQIRNALIVLTKVLPHYPRISQFGQALERRVDRLRDEEKEKRPDLFALAMGYSGQLKSKKSTWVPETEFHLKEREKEAAKKEAAADKKKENSTTTDGQDGKKVNGETKAQSKKAENAKTKEAKKAKLDGKKSDDKKEKIKENGKKEDKVSSKEQDKNSEEKSSKEKRSEDKKEEKGKELKKEADKKVKEEKIKLKEERNSKVKEDLVEKTRIKEETAKEDRVKSREDGKEKMTKKDHDKIKIKRSKSPGSERSKRSPAPEKVKHSPEKSKHGHSPKRTRSPEHEREVGGHDGKERTVIKQEKRTDDYHSERASSVASTGSHGSHAHPSPDMSPHHDERDVKRRRLEPSGGQTSSKEKIRSLSKERHKQSPSYDREERKERKDRKRESLDDRLENEPKRRKSHEPSLNRSSGKINGDPDSKHSSKKDHERWVEPKHNSYDYFESPEDSPQSQRQKKEKSKKSDRERSRDREKISGTKKSKK